LLQLAKNNCAPAAIINEEAEPIIAVGAIIARIPMVDRLEKGAYARIKDGTQITVDGSKGMADVKEG
jgi:predicted aconitase with swiveling domain